jgi:hypothetical protein
MQSVTDIVLVHAPWRHSWNTHHQGRMAHQAQGFAAKRGRPGSGRIAPIALLCTLDPAGCQGIINSGAKAHPLPQGGSVCTTTALLSTMVLCRQ